VQYTRREQEGVIMGSERALLVTVALLTSAVLGVLAPAVGGQAVAPDATQLTTTLPAESARVRWRVRIPLDYFIHTPGVGPDGTVYVPNLFGRTQAINPIDGSTKWSVGAGGMGAPISVGADGTVYVAGNGPGAVGGTDAVTALRPDGTVKWAFTATGDYLLAGPSVGPDGNIYAVTDTTGIGFFSLTPTGQRRFATGRFSEYGPVGQRIAFGPDRAYFGFDMYGVQPPTLFAYDLKGTIAWTASSSDSTSADVGPNGNVVFGAFPTGVGRSLVSRTPAGSLVYSFYEFPGNTQEAPDVGPDDVAYTVRNLSTLYGINPNGSVKFRYTDEGIMFEPVVRPQNDLVFMGGRVTYGEPAFFRAVSTAGRGLWQVPLPTEPGYGDYGQLVPVSRPVFSPNASTAYQVVDVAGDGATPYAQLFAYLYAVDLSGDGAPASATPLAPTNLTAKSIRASAVRLTWTDRSTNETQFVVQRCTGLSCTAYTEIARVGANTTTWTNTGLTSGQYYSYRVRALNAAGLSTPSNTATARAR
jgi:hypothetical protein